MEKRLNYKVLQNSPDFKNPKPELEQYSTPVDITLEIIKHANSLGHLSGKVVDLGCGTGRLAIGAAILGANNLAGVIYAPWGVFDPKNKKKRSENSFKRIR